MPDWIRHTLLAVLAATLCSCATLPGGGGLRGQRDPGLPEPVLDESLSAQRTLPVPSEIRRSALFVCYHRYFAPRAGRESQVLRGLLARGGSVIPYARRVFKEKGVPQELIYLPIIESGFHAGARSWAGATGLWQFMPETARDFGLSMDWWQDQRKDPYLSTVAAADFLKALYAEFRDWSLVLAAYNCGPGLVRRALDGAEERSFSCLARSRRLPQETIHYVPKFFAAVEAVAAMETSGLIANNKRVEQNVVHIEVAGSTDLQGLSNACGLPWTEFKRLNPHLHRSATPPDRIASVYLPRRVKGSALEFLGGSPNRLVSVDRNKYFSNSIKKPLIAAYSEPLAQPRLAVADVVEPAPRRDFQAKEARMDPETAAVLGVGIPAGPVAKLLHAAAGLPENRMDRRVGSLRQGRLPSRTAARQQTAPEVFRTAEGAGVKPLLAAPSKASPHLVPLLADACGGAELLFHADQSSWRDPSRLAPESVRLVRRVIAPG